MVKQYPYLLQVFVQADATMDNNGNWIPGTQSWVDVCECRDESGSGKRITLTDGSVYEYNALIQCPVIDQIKPGTMIRVIDGNVIRVEKAVVYSRKDQMHTRIWV
jgi:hypothetical protein